jgi:hypothetical protein
MTYEEFLEFIPSKCMYETVYTDSDGHPILVMRLLDAYGMANKLASVEREACAKLRETLHPFDLHNRSEMLGVMNQSLDDYQNLIRARGNHD